MRVLITIIAVILIIFVIAPTIPYFIAAIIAFVSFILTQVDDSQFNGMYSALTAIGTILSGFVLFFLIYEFIVNKRRELSLREKEVLIFYQNHLPNIRVQTYEEIDGKTSAGKTVIVSLHNFSQRTAFKVKVEICAQECFRYPLCDSIDEFTPSTSMSITLEDIIDPIEMQPRRAPLKSWTEYYSEDPHKEDAHITYVKLTFYPSMLSEEYKTTKMYKIYLDEIDEGQGKKLIVSKSIIIKVDMPQISGI